MVKIPLGSVEAEAGDRVEFQIRYTNTSNEDQLRVAVIKTLPDGLRYIDDSTRIIIQHILTVHKLMKILLRRMDF